MIQIGPRELLITGISCLAALLLTMAPIATLVKVGLVVTTLGVSILLAYGRSASYGDTIEASLLRTWRRHSTQQNQSVGYGFIDERPESDAWTRDPQSRWMTFEKVLKRGQVDKHIWITPLPLTWKSLLLVLGSSFLIMSLVWIWSGRF
jgi:hypothetical protein